MLQLPLGLHFLFVGHLKIVLKTPLAGVDGHLGIGHHTAPVGDGMPLIEEGSFVQGIVVNLLLLVGGSWGRLALNQTRDCFYFLQIVESYFSRVQLLGVDQFYSSVFVVPLDLALEALLLRYFIDELLLFVWIDAGPILLFDFLSKHHSFEDFLFVGVGGLDWSSRSRLGEL